MIKVAVYNYSYEYEDDEPVMVLSLKEFEEKFNKRFEDDLDFDPRYIKFIVV